jgi:hypothetical protein
MSSRDVESVMQAPEAVSFRAEEEHFAFARRHRREKCYLAVELRQDQDENLMLASLSDVSAGGCCLETCRMLASGTVVAISPLEANGLLWVQGVAVNMRMGEGLGTFKIGIKFLEAEPSPTHILQEFLRFVEASAERQMSGDSLYRQRLAGN